MSGFGGRSDRQPSPFQLMLYPKLDEYRWRSLRTPRPDQGLWVAESARLSQSQIVRASRARVRVGCHPAPARCDNARLLLEDRDIAVIQQPRIVHDQR